MIEVRNLHFAYRDKPILKGINFSIKKGDTLSILGANGSGKSTLLRIMLGFLKFKGEVLIKGKSVRDYGKRELASLVAYVPQTHAPLYDYSVFDVALMGALCRTPLFSSFSAADKKLAEQALEKMGIAHLKKHAIHQDKWRPEAACLHRAHAGARGKGDLYGRADKWP